MIGQDNKIKVQIEQRRELSKRIVVLSLKLLLCMSMHTHSRGYSLCDCPSTFILELQAARLDANGFSTTRA